MLRSSLHSSRFGFEQSRIVRDPRLHNIIWREVQLLHSSQIRNGSFRLFPLVNGVGKKFDLYFLWIDRAMTARGTCTG